MGSEIETVGELLKQVRELILAGRKAAARTVDSIQVAACFEIGRRIVEHEQQGTDRAAYGKNLLRDLAARLTSEFGPGFSKSNLEYMRRFYLMYQDGCPAITQTLSGQLTASRKTQTVSGRLVQGSKSETSSRKSSVPQKRLLPPMGFTLSWSGYIFLMGIKNRAERSFYEIEAAVQGWSVRELKRQFNSGLYERLALSRDKEGIRKLARKGHIVAKPQDLLKEPYVLEFLGLDEKAKYSESDLESAIIDKLEHFLLELGKGFLFEARQKRFTFAEEHFFVDLVFYNRILRCYVLIDLKIGKLAHQDLGQMQMYVNHFDRHVKSPDEKSTVGIILCKKKHDALVEITLPQDANIFASQYQLYLPTKEELRQKLLDWMEEQGEQ